MTEWNQGPERVASMIVQHYPCEADEIALDFLEHAAGTRDHGQTLFWIIVVNLVEDMQTEQQSAPDFLPEIRLAPIM